MNNTCVLMYAFIYNVFPSLNNSKVIDNHNVVTDYSCSFLNVLMKHIGNFTVSLVNNINSTPSQ